MAKLLLHNLSIPYANSIGMNFNFDQGGVLFAEQGDIVVTREKISEAYLFFLNTIGYDISRIHFISSRGASPKDPFSIFSDSTIIDAILKISEKKNKPLVLDSFMFTHAEAKWAKKVGALSFGDPVHYYEFGGKSNFRSLMKQNKISIPRGFENQQSIVGGVIKAYTLFLLGAGEVVIKQDEGVAGIGSRRFKRDQFVSSARTLNTLFPDPCKEGIIPTTSSKFVVEKWHPNIRLSPSVQFFISPKGSVRVLSAHIQILCAEPCRMCYRGCYSSHWLTEEAKNKLMEEGGKIARIVAQKGFRGHMGLNAIILENGKLLWVELNPRRVISSYSFHVWEKTCGISASTHCYITKLVTKRKWIGKNIDYILAQLSPLLFSPHTRTGIIPLHHNNLYSLGQITLMCIEKNKEQAEMLLSETEQL